MKKMSHKLPKSLTEEEFKKLIKKVRHKDKEAKVSFLLAYGSGLRISEVINLTPKNIRTDTKPPLIEVLSGKGSRDRQVPIPKGWKPWMLDVLPIKKGIRSLQRNFKVACNKAGLSNKYVFHSLRHSFGTRLIEKGVPPNQVQLLMGHSNLSTTSVYIRARPKDAIKSYEDLF